MLEQRRPRGHSEDHLQEQSQTGHGSQGLSPPKSKYCVIVQQSVWLCVHLRTCSTILDLAGVETLLIRVLHASKHPCATEAHWIDGALIMERHSIRDDLKKVHNLRRVALFWTGDWSATRHAPLLGCRPLNLPVQWGRLDVPMSPEGWVAPASENNRWASSS